MVLLNCNYNKFIEMTKGKTVVCYGAGKMLKEAEEEFKGTDLNEKISCIVDGNSKIWDVDINLFDKKYKIHSPQKILGTMDKNTIILITSGAFIDIIEILKTMIPENTEIFIFSFMRSYQRDLDMIQASSTGDSSLYKYKEKKIPKKIHYCWFGRKELPDLHKRCIESWYKYCPDYQIVEWNEDNCDLDDNLYAKQAYECGRYGFVPDYFRLKIIYETGGIYLDTDVEVIKNLDDLLYNEAYASFESLGYVNLGSGFGACANFPLLKEMMEEYENINFKEKDGSLNLIASPIYQTKVLKRYGLNENGSMQNINGMKIYPFDYLCAQSIYTGMTYVTKNTYSIHKFAASWVEEEKAKERESKLKLLREITKWR